MTGNELFDLDAFLTELFLGDATLVALLGAGPRIFSENALPGTPAPFLVMNFQSAKDIVAIGAIRIITQPLYCIKAITQDSSFNSANSIAGRIDALVMGSTGIGPKAGNNISCSGREGSYRTWEEIQGLRWNYVGALYRFWVY